MKKILVENVNNFDLVDVVKKYNNKINFKEFLKKNKILSVFMILSVLVSVVFNTGSTFLNLLNMILRWVPISVGFVFIEKYFNRKEAKKKLEYSLYCEDGIDEELSVKDYEDAVIYSSKPVLETHYLCNDEATKVENKKVVSYIALTKKEKLVIFKQILNQLKFDSDNIKDTNLVEINLLEDMDLEKERIINFDGSYNKTNPLVKKLIKKII